jgi:hypothetical protein
MSPPLPRTKLPIHVIKSQIHLVIQSPISLHIRSFCAIITHTVKMYTHCFVNLTFCTSMYTISVQKFWNLILGPFTRLAEEFYGVRSALDNLVHCSESVFVNLLWSPGIDFQPGGPVRRPYLT